MQSAERRWPFRALLLAVLLLVCGVNAWHLDRNPMPPPSSHRTWLLVPRIMHYFMGYEHRRLSIREPPQLSGAAAFYTLPVRHPFEWTSPAAVIHELRYGGRLRQLVGECGVSYTTCMPHGYAILGAVGALLPGRGLLISLVPTGYFLLLLAALYGIGVEASGRPAGVAAAAIGAGYPGLFGMARWPEGYIVITALSTGMVWCLLRSRGLTRWLPLAGFCGLAWTAIRTGEGFSESCGAGLAVAGPSVVALGVGLVEAARARRLPLRTLGGAAIVGVFLWQTTDWDWVRDSLRQMTAGLTEVAMDARLSDPNASPLMRKLASHGIYVLFIVNDYLRPTLVAWLLVAAPFLFRARHRLMLAAWFLVTFLGYSAMARKSIWYPIPMLPPLAAITAVGLASLPRLRSAGLILASLTALHQLVTLTVPGAPTTLPGWLTRPVRHEIVQVRWVDLATTGEPDTRALTRDARQLLNWLDRSVPRAPPGDGAELIYVGVATPWGEDPTHAMRLGYYLTLRRPDLVVVELGVKRYLDGRAYDGLSTERFAMLVCIGANGSFTKCGANSADGRGPAPAPYTRMVGLLLDRARGSIPGVPPVLLLRHPAVDGAAALLPDALP